MPDPSAMLLDVFALAQAVDPESGAANDSGAVFIVGFILIGIIAVLGARWYRRRQG